jgi:hypothetical protein
VTGEDTLLWFGPSVRVVTRKQASERGSGGGGGVAASNARGRGTAVVRRVGPSWWW